MRKFGPSHIILFSFLAAIIAGTILLSLPFAAQAGDKVSIVDRLFTATSATCVTGLTVKDTGSWAPFGKFVIMLLFQTGGLGIMTFSTFFVIMLGRKVTIKDNLVVRGTIGQYGIKNFKTLILYIAAIVFMFESLGALALFLRWRTTTSWPIGTTIYNSVFHSISAFCNAGFSLFKNSFIGFNNDIVINIIMIALIFFGGIGFIVILDLWKLRLRKKDKRPLLARMSLQSKMALSISLSLIILGALVIFLLENNNAFLKMGPQDKVLSSFFQAVTTRTAGFNSISIKQFAPATLLFMIFLMFIGASPGSTGGGIKTCTFGVLIASLFSMIKNKERVWVFRKSIPKIVIRKAISIFILALFWIFIFSLLLSITERGNIFGKDYYLRILFETTSAFGTVGLSTGITPMLSNLGKILLIITMLVGRIGPLTLALAVALQEEKLLFNYPEEHVMAG